MDDDQINKLISDLNLLTLKIDGIAKEVLAMMKRIEAMTREQTAMSFDMITSLRLSTRARKAVYRLGVTSIKQLLNKTPDEILCLRSVGEGTLNEIRKALAERNLRLRND